MWYIRLRRQRAAYLKQSDYFAAEQTDAMTIIPDHPSLARIPPGYRQRLSPKAIDIIAKVHDWVENECIPADHIVKAQLAQNRWATPPYIKELRQKAQEAGLFNLFLPNHFKESPGLTILEYSCCCELLGRVYWAPMVCERTVT